MASTEVCVTEIQSKLKPETREPTPTTPALRIQHFFLNMFKPQLTS